MPDAHRPAACDDRHSDCSTRRNAVDVLDQLDAIVPDLKRVAEGVRADQLGGPTPCANFAVRDLFTHMIVGASAFAPQLRGDGTAPESRSLDDDALHGSLDDALDELMGAVRTPGALGRTVSVPFGEVPGEVLARFLTVDAMVHTSDIARATGQDYDPPEELAADVLRTARDLIAPAMRDGDTFAAEQPVAADAPSLARLVAFTGRTI
jgi:uncharacterized protein (TIGR03086 family)